MIFKQGHRIGLLAQTATQAKGCAAALVAILCGLPPLAQATFAAACGAVVGASTAGLSSSAAKAQVFSAVRAASAAASMPVECRRVDEIDQLEQVLQAFSPVLHQVSITSAKHWLREATQPKLASRLSRLTQGRNRRAHADSSLLDDVQQLVAAHVASTAEVAGRTTCSVSHSDSAVDSADV